MGKIDFVSMIGRYKQMPNRCFTIKMPRNDIFIIHFRAFFSGYEIILQNIKCEAVVFVQNVLNRFDLLRKSDF